MYSQDIQHVQYSIGGLLRSKAFGAGELDDGIWDGCGVVACLEAMRMMALKYSGFLANLYAAVSYHHSVRSRAVVVVNPAPGTNTPPLNMGKLCSTCLCISRPYNTVSSKYVQRRWPKRVHPRGIRSRRRSPS